MVVPPKPNRDQIAKAKLVSPARGHRAGAPSPIPVERVAARTKRDPIWCTK